MFQAEGRIQEINSKYSRFEEDVLVKLQKLASEDKALKEKYPVEDEKSPGTSIDANASIDLQASLRRNKQLRQDLDKSKARFRSRTTYSPVEKILERAKKDYLLEFSAQRP